MSIKYKDIVPSIQTLNKLNNEKLPIKIAYNVCKCIRGIETELEFYNKAKRELINEVCKKSEDGTPIIKDGNYDILDVERWNKEMDELLNIEIDTSNIISLNINDLENIEITASEISTIEFLFNEKW